MKNQNILYINTSRQGGMKVDPDEIRGKRSGVN